MPGAIIVQFAIDTMLRASKIIEPSEGAGGGVPSPRNDSDASVSTAHESESAVWTMTRPPMLGSTCRAIVTHGFWPVLTAARTKSCSRSESTGPRATRKKIGT